VKRRSVFLAALALLLSACGYHITGQGDMIPKSIKTIAVPPFENITTRQTLARMLAADVTREFNSRTRYRIVDDRDQADAVLQGRLTNFSVNPIIFDPNTGAATTVHVHAVVQVTLTDRATGKVIFSRANMEWDERYQVSNNAQEYFDESGTAIIRISQDMSHMIVSGVLENF
jgi:hypothetical protein